MREGTVFYAQGRYVGEERLNALCHALALTCWRVFFSHGICSCPRCGAGKGRLTARQWVPCVCLHGAIWWASPGDMAGLELHLQLAGLLLGRLVCRGKVSVAAALWIARGLGSAEGPEPAFCSQSTVVGLWLELTLRRTEPPVIGVEICKSLSLGFHRLVTPATSPLGAWCFEKVLL